MVNDDALDALRELARALEAMECEVCEIVALLSSAIWFYVLDCPAQPHRVNRGCTRPPAIGRRALPRRHVPPWGTINLPVSLPFGSRGARKGPFGPPPLS